MIVLLIRHAIAVERDDWNRRGRNDDLRPLTEAGRKRMRQAAIGLFAAEPRLTVLATSPLVRAVETAALIAKAYPKVETVELKDLSPGGDHQALLRWLQRHKKDATVAFVGHEPDLSATAACLLSGKRRRIVRMKKGGALAIAFNGEIAAGAGTLLWCLPPRLLRRLAKH